MRIFVSYRRGDAEGWARRLIGDLRSRFGTDAVAESGTGGDPATEMVTCDILIGIIGPHWPVTGSDSSPVGSAGDPTGLEIATALERGLRLVPVLVGGASVPPADRVPEALRPLVRRQAQSLNDQRWRSDVAELIASLDQGRRAQPLRLLLTALLSLLVGALAGGLGVLWFRGGEADEPWAKLVLSLDFDTPVGRYFSSRDWALLDRAREYPHADVRFAIVEGKEFFDRSWREAGCIGSRSYAAFLYLIVRFAHPQ
jgi:hypothetical protein